MALFAAPNPRKSETPLPHRQAQEAPRLRIGESRRPPLPHRQAQEAPRLRIGESRRPPLPHCQ
eukprot:8818968-Alexandrium_andersonii.AAC.1